MYTRENSNPLVECNVRRLTRSGATSMPSDVESATRSSSRSMLSSSVPPLHVVERGTGGEDPVEGPSISARRRAPAAGYRFAVSGSPRPNCPPTLELAVDPGQRHRVVQRVVGPPGVDPEPQGQVLELGAVAGERARERQRVVEQEVVDSILSGPDPAQHGNVEMLAVV